MFLFYEFVEHIVQNYLLVKIAALGFNLMLKVLESNILVVVNA